MKKSESSMSYEEKKRLAEKTLRANGYNKEEIAKIIKKAFGDPPKKGK